MYVVKEKENSLQEEKKRLLRNLTLSKEVINIPLMEI